VSVAAVGTSGVSTWLSLPFTSRYATEVQAGQSWRMQGLPSLVVSLAPSSWASPAQALGLVVGVVLVALFVHEAWRAPATASSQVWAFAALTTVVAAPHLLEYDLVFAVPAFLHLLEHHDRRRTRVALVVLAALTWTGYVRHLLAGVVPWPLSVVGAGWGAVPLLVLWLMAWRDLRAPRPDADVDADPGVMAYDPSQGSCQRPSPATRSSAASGPQLPGA
jgi:hypothetical protein